MRNGDIGDIGANDSTELLDSEDWNVLYGSSEKREQPERPGDKNFMENLRLSRIRRIPLAGDPLPSRLEIEREPRLRQSPIGRVERKNCRMNLRNK